MTEENGFYGIRPYGPHPNERQLRHIKKFSQKVFFHFGVNTFTELEWGEGGESEKLFDPSELDVGQWIRVAAQAGARLAIITAKHHDGFCLWSSAYTEHCVKNSPYKNGKGDVVREFTEACRRYGLGVGIYISPYDRSVETWGTPAYSEYYAAQLTELMTGYGHIDEVWWDGAGSAETPYDWGAWADIIRKNQPDAVIFGSLGATEYVDIRWVGNECGYAGATNYATIDPKYLIHETPAELNRGSIITPQELESPECLKRYIPAEVDVSIRPGWFYHEAQDGEVKSVNRLARIWFSSVGANAFELLNLPPDRRGLVHPKDAENARLASDIIRTTFATNLAFGAKVTADSTYSAECGADNLLQPYEKCFYAADNTSAELLFELPAQVTFDCYSLREVVELGERITEHTLYVEGEGGEWREIAKNTSVGILRAEYFPQVTASRIKLCIKGYASPVLERFGLHKLPCDISDDVALSDKTDLLSKKNASVSISEDRRALTAEFGGVYPFDTVTLNCECVWRLKIYAFNGQEYYLIHEAIQPEHSYKWHFDAPIDGSYRVKIETDTQAADKLEPHFYMSVRPSARGAI